MEINIEYQVVETNNKTGTVNVRYFVRDLDVKGVNINLQLPLIDGKYPTLEEVQTIINRAAPIKYFQEQLAKKTTGADMSHINEIMNQILPVDTSGHVGTLLNPPQVPVANTAVTPSVHQVDII